MLLAKYTSVILILLLSGCATFRDGPNPPITKWPPGSVAKNKTIALQVTGKAIVNNQPAEATVKFLEKWREEAVRAYESSGFFTSVKGGSNQADVHAEITIIDKGEASKGLAFLTGFTMFIIPSHIQEGFIVKTTYKDNSGNSIGSFEKSESADTWMQLFLFPVTPFKERA
jgi:hypothetical protein